MPPGPLVAALDRGGRGALLALGLFALVHACRRAPPPAPAPPRAAATVNGSPIPVSRVQVELDRMRLGDEVDVFGEDSGYRYRVVDIRAVPRDDLSLLGPTINASVSLITSTVTIFPSRIRRRKILADVARPGGA